MKLEIRISKHEMVEYLTTLSHVEGQIQMTKTQNG
jgi:hypothetical protein